MLQGVKRVLMVPELKEKILFTLMMLFVCRIGGFIPVPGINSEVASAYFKQALGGSQNIFQMVDMFSGGAFSQMTVIALGVVPYISASIMMQLLVSLWPSLQREIRENPTQGRRKVNRMSRMLTLALAFIQATFFAKYALRMNSAQPGLIVGELLEYDLFGFPILFYLITVFTMTTGTLFLMWIGEQITEKGIGNGMSLIISLGILAQIPSAFGVILQMLNLDSQQAGQMSLTTVVVLMTIFVLVTIGTILVIQGHRRIPLQYARRVVGRHEVQGSNSYIPLKVNYAGVIPVIFATYILLFPATIITFLGEGNFLSGLVNWVQPNSMAYNIFFVTMIIFFTYFWTATQFKPDQIASDMKKNGAFVPGIKQGRSTQEFLEMTMNRITLIGALSLAVIAVLPKIIGSMLNVPSTISYFFGGTSLLILVGVVLDTMKQIESHLIMKRYDGFMKRGRIRGR